MKLTSKTSSNSEPDLTFPFPSCTVAPLCILFRNVFSVSYVCYCCCPLCCPSDDANKSDRAIYLLSQKGRWFSGWGETNSCE